MFELSNANRCGYTVTNLKVTLKKLKDHRPGWDEHGPRGGVCFVEVACYGSRVGDGGAGGVVVDDEYGVEGRDAIGLRASGLGTDNFGKS